MMDNAWNLVSGENLVKRGSLSSLFTYVSELNDDRRINVEVDPFGDRFHVTVLVSETLLYRKFKISM